MSRRVITIGIGCAAAGACWTLLAIMVYATRIDQALHAVQLHQAEWWSGTTQDHLDENYRRFQPFGSLIRASMAEQADQEVFSAIASLRQRLSIQFGNIVLPRVDGGDLLVALAATLPTVAAFSVVFFWYAARAAKIIRTPRSPQSVPARRQFRSVALALLLTLLGLFCAWAGVWVAFAAGFQPSWSALNRPHAAVPPASALLKGVAASAVLAGVVWWGGRHAVNLWAWLFGRPHRKGTCWACGHEGEPGNACCHECGHVQSDLRWGEQLRWRISQLRYQPVIRAMLFPVAIATTVLAMMAWRWKDDLPSKPSDALELALGSLPWAILPTELLQAPRGVSEVMLTPEPTILGFKDGSAIVVSFQDRAPEAIGHPGRIVLAWCWIESSKPTPFEVVVRNLPKNPREAYFDLGRDAAPLQRCTGIEILWANGHGPRRAIIRRELVSIARCADHTEFMRLGEDMERAISAAASEPPSLTVQ